MSYFVSEEVAPGKKPTFADLELRLVQSKKDIEDPETCVKGIILKSEHEYISW